MDETPWSGSRDYSARSYSLFSVVSLSWCEVAGGGFRFSACGLTYLWREETLCFGYSRQIVCVCVCACKLRVCLCVRVFQCVCVTQSPRSPLTPSPGHCGHSVHKPGLEENVCVIEHTVLQRNNDELRTAKMAPQHLTDILRSGRREL